MAGPVIAVERFLELSLIGLLASGLLALASTGYLDAVSLGLGGAGLAVRLLRTLGLVRARVGWRWLRWQAAAGLAGAALDYLLISKTWLAACLHLGFFGAALGVAVARPGRADLWLGVGALAALLAASWWSTHLYFVGALAAFLLFGVAVFASAELRRGARRQAHVVPVPGRGLAGRLAALSLWLAAGILALTAGLFFVLPRTAQVAVRRLAPERFRVSFSPEELRLGEQRPARRQPVTLARVRFYGFQPAGPLKWRANALERFDGRRWHSAGEATERLATSEGLVKVADNRQLWRAGQRILYEVRLGELGSGTLYLAGTPEFLRVNAPAVVRTSSGAYRLGVSEGVRYGASAFLEPSGLPEVGAPSAGPPPSCCLELPRLDPRIAELARRLTAGAATPETRAEALARHFQRGYAYSTKSPSDRAPDPLADFLFVSRRGHCEYFASALAVLLRSAGIPSRLVTGFQGGAHNPVSGWEVIRASDLHAWVEAWLPGRGWASFDPTPPRSGGAAPGPWTRLGWYLDAAQTFWEEWVLRYDLTRQLVLAAKMESSGRDLSTHWMDRARARVSQIQEAAEKWGRRYAPPLLGLLAAVAAVRVAAPRLRDLWRRRQGRRRAARGEAERADATLLYERMLQVLARRGLRKPTAQTPAEFAGSLPASPLKTLLEQFTQAYNELRFGGQRAAAMRMAVLLERARTSL